MSKILYKDGKIMYEQGEVIYSDTPEACECCSGVAAFCCEVLLDGVSCPSSGGGGSVECWSVTKTYDQDTGDWTVEMASCQPRQQICLSGIIWSEDLTIITGSGSNPVMTSATSIGTKTSSGICSGVGNTFFVNQNPNEQIILNYAGTSDPPTAENCDTWEINFDSCAAPGKPSAAFVFTSQECCCKCTDEVIVVCDDGGCGDGAGSHWSNFPESVCCDEVYTATLTIDGAMSGGEGLISGNLGPGAPAATAGSWVDCGNNNTFEFLTVDLPGATIAGDTVNLGIIPPTGITATVSFRINCDPDSPNECICVRILGGNIIGDGREWLLYPPLPC